MKLTVLCDNNTITDVYLTGEPALSFFIEDSGKKILFDTGYSDVFIKNAKALGINLLFTDYIVLSHGHIDHTGGLVHLKEMYKKAEEEGFSFKKPTLIAHPLLFRNVYEEPFGNIGSPLKQETASQFSDVILTEKPYELTENLLFLGQINEKTSFEPLSYAGVSKDSSGNLTPDFSPDDSALLYSGENGLSVITGCSHSGICSILKEAKKVSGRDDFIDIIGGFHLLDAGYERISKTGEFLKKSGIRNIHPCHCTDFTAKAALLKYLSVTEVGCGSVFEF